MNTVDDKQKPDVGTAKMIAPLTGEELDRYQEQVKAVVAQHLQDTTTLCEKFTEQFKAHHRISMSDPEAWQRLIVMWLGEVGETMKAIELLVKERFDLQAISLSRTILEIYFTLEWVFEKNNPEMRIELLKINSLDKKIKEFEKYKVAGEVEVYKQESLDPKKILNERVERFVKRFSSEFSNETKVEAELKKIQSYPKIESPEKAGLIDEYKENKQLYERLSSAVHAKDLIERAPRYDIRQLTDDERVVLDFNQAMLLIDMSHTVLHIVSLLAKKCGVDSSPLHDSMMELHQRRNAFLFARPL
jgi:hypothetical protein